MNTNTKPALCERHNIQPFILTSPHLAAAIKRGDHISSDEITKLKIFSMGKYFEYLIDIKFLKELKITPVDGVVIMRDRDKTEKKMNDRLLVQKIMREMKWVCPLCLSEVTECPKERSQI